MQIKINVDLMKLQAIGENLLLICLSVTFYTLLTSTKSCFIREFLVFFFFLLGQKRTSPVIAAVEGWSLGWPLGKHVM